MSEQFLRSGEQHLSRFILSSGAYLGEAKETSYTHSSKGLVPEIITSKSLYQFGDMTVNAV